MMLPSDRERESLFAFLDPVLKGAGYELRPFGINAFNRSQLLGLAIFTPKFAELDGAEQHMHLMCMLVLQCAPLAKVNEWVRTYFKKPVEFFWEVAFSYFPEDMDMSPLLAASAQVAQTGPAVEAANLEIVEPAGAERGERPPPNA